MPKAMPKIMPEAMPKVMPKAMIVRGPCRLRGRVRVSGSKNAALPQLAASLLTKEWVVLDNLPQLTDIETMLNLLGGIGVKVERQGARVRLCAAEIAADKADYQLVRQMRASVLVLGPLLARLGEARAALPGGCAIGPRPIDMHIKALEAMGGVSSLSRGDICLRVAGRLRGSDIKFPRRSMGATTNAILAATLAEGTTRIANGALEPEVRDLCFFLNRCLGAEVKVGNGKWDYQITGRAQLGKTPPLPCQMPSDRIEAGTYAIAAVATDGDLVLEECPMESLDALWRALEKSGAGVTFNRAKKEVRVRGRSGLKPLGIKAVPWPGFPTDLQAQWMALAAAKALGPVKITDAVFPHRFIHAGELVRMGANIRQRENYALVAPPSSDGLQGAEVMASDLRASVALVIAALVAKGETKITRIYHLRRGYENLVEKFGGLGASIREE